MCENSPGIAIRILGEVTPERVRIARAADHIFISEIRDAGVYDEVSQFPPPSLPSLFPARAFVVPLLLAIGVLPESRERSRGRERRS